MLDFVRVADDLRDVNIPARLSESFMEKCKTLQIMQMPFKEGENQSAVSSSGQWTDEMIIPGIFFYNIINLVYLFFQYFILIGVFFEDLS